jgi:deoxyadenosine/deoxycytidine kinase
MTGKTEIAKELSKQTGIPYFKASSEHKTYLKEDNMFIQQLRYADPRMTDFLGQTGYSAIFDRAYPCEWVYSKVFDRETDEKALETIDGTYAAMGTRIVITRRHSYENIVDDIDKNINSDVLLKLDREYYNFSQWTKCKTLVLNVDDEDLTRELNDINLWIRGTE